MFIHPEKTFKPCTLKPQSKPVMKLQCANSLARGCGGVTAVADINALQPSLETA